MKKNFTEIEIPFGVKDSKVIVKKKESEDERIRKALVKTFEKKLEISFEWTEFSIPNRSVLDWLEKQKDKRELDFAEGKVEGAKQVCQEIKDAMSLYEPKDLTPFESAFRDYIDSAIRYCLAGEGYQQYIKEWAADLLNLEKQKEQKPESCDCSRDEESYTNGIHHVLMNPEVYGLIKQKPAEQLGGTFTSYDMAKTFTEGQNYVIAHPEKFGLCKPAEWSEEDEGMLNCIIATLCEESHGGRESNDKMVTWLDNRLKSLRPQPHWKPSEEQMEALSDAYVEASTFKKGDILESLYNDLKKLL